MPPSQLSLLATCYAFLSMCKFGYGIAAKPNHVVPTPTLAKITGAALQKRDSWVSVCPSSQSTSCPVIGVSDITSAGSGHYIPVCAGTSCQWLGYELPTTSFPSTTYDLVSSGTAEPYVVPVPIPPVGGPPPPPPPGPPPPDPPGDLPDPPDDPEITEPPQTTPACSNPPDATTTPVGFDDDWFTDVISDWGSTLTYFLDYEIPLTPTSSAPSSSSLPAPSPTPSSNSDCYTVTKIVWVNGNGQNYDNLNFNVYGKYTGNSPYVPVIHTVWDGNNAADATPTVASAPGPLPLFLIQVYDHDQDWVQYNYGAQAWASSDTQCTDDHWAGNNGIYPMRTINCTFSC